MNSNTFPEIRVLTTMSRLSLRLTEAAESMLFSSNEDHRLVFHILELALINIFSFFPLNCHADNFRSRVYGSVGVGSPMLVPDYSCCRLGLRDSSFSRSGGSSGWPSLHSRTISRSETSLLPNRETLRFPSL